jgi:hypothetical protein
MQGGLNLGFVNNQEYFIELFARHICEKISQVMKVLLPLITAIREVDKCSGKLLGLPQDIYFQATISKKF